MGGGKGGQSSTSTTQTTMPAWLTGAQQNLLGVGQDILGQFLNAPAYRVAGFTPDQTAAFDLTRQMTMDSFSGGRPSAMANGGAGTTTAATGNATQVTGPEIMASMNPFIQSVLDPTLSSMRRGYRQNAAEIGARSAAAGSFGGSREAIQRGQLDRSYGEQLQKTVADLMAQGYDRATALAQANANLRQQMEMQNVSNRQQASMQSANNALRSVEMESNLIDADQRRKMNMLNLLLGIGGAQQNLAQKGIDVPVEALNILKGLVPMNQTDSQQVKQTESDGGGGGIGQLVGLIGSFL